jgi:hypothetical protein
MKQYDVIVCGGGPSGTVAAISAARNGASVLLIEKNGFLGGMNTAGLVGPLMTFHAGNTQIIKGIADEIVTRLKQKGGSYGHIPDPLGVCATITPFEPNILKSVYFEMIQECPSIDLLLHTYITKVNREGEMISSITCVNKSGEHHFSAKTYIDATGDGDVAFFSSAHFKQGRQSDGFSQPMSLMFKLSGVDLNVVRAYMKENPKEFVLDDNVDLDGYVAVSGFFKQVNLAKENGDFNIARDRVLFFQGMHEDEVFINMSRVIQLDATKGEDLTNAETIAHKQVDIIIKFLQKYVPGFANCYLSDSADCIGVRESRRFDCLYTLTEDDIAHPKNFEDSVATCAFPIDIHDPTGTNLNCATNTKGIAYNIPYRVMVVKTIDNLLVTGRCIDATHEALASARITATAMALGEAAGVAATLASKQGIPFAQVDVHELKEILENQGAITHVAQ